MSLITVIYDHSDFLVINKPVGIPVQNEPDLPGILPRLCTQTDSEKLWLVHRLDKVTSGLLMLAKTQAAASTLSQLFAKRQVSKYYLAISDKKPKKKQGSVVGDMRKARNGIWMLSQHLTSPAVSQFFSQGLGNGLRLFVIKPWTGKTHQIRVMMKSLGSPILGDTNYKGSDSDRVYLHAFALQFAYQGNNITLTCPPEAGQHFTETSCAAQLPKIASPADLDWPKLKPGLIQAIGHSNDHQVWAEYD